MPKITKKHPFEVFFAVFRGPERIRTAVQAFAELCLATRPQDHILLTNYDWKFTIACSFFSNSDCKSTSIVPKCQNFFRKIYEFICDAKIAIPSVKLTGS